MKPILFFLITASFVQAQIPIAPGAELKLAADGYKFTEGPAVDAKGNVYFTDQPNDRILKWSADTGKIEDFMKPAGRSNGLCFDREGKLIACADEKGQLWRIDPETKKVTVLLDNYDKKLFNGPNDVWVDPAGGMYFTDPFYKRDYWQGREKPDQEKQRVYYLPKGAKAPAIAEETLVQPNGIIGSSDGKLLFVADIGAKNTYQYDIAKDGKLTNRKLFCEMGSDGMTRDSAGNIYLTGKGVTVFDKDGKKLGEIPNTESWTANVCFGGKDMKTLFITAMDSLYTVEMSVAGTR
ncbi:MAG: SMP-30/gluconolactonase/LRE family protein [Luteolibacter sp.]|uniref:SMP-30/gluconolactonase/LRE family protein n=1 Tax=Luteolibacter sp. TaxID=1962973 RepID=UPI003265DF5B